MVHAYPAPGRHRGHGTGPWARRTRGSEGRGWEGREGRAPGLTLRASGAREGTDPSNDAGPSLRAWGASTERLTRSSPSAYLASPVPATLAVVRGYVLCSKTEQRVRFDTVYPRRRPGSPADTRTRP